MIKTLSAYIGQYKKDSVKAPFYIIFEVLMEILIPFVTASIIDKGIQAGNMKNVYIYGGVMIVLCKSVLWCSGRKVCSQRINWLCLQLKRRNIYQYTEFRIF